MHFIKTKKKKSAISSIEIFQAVYDTNEYTEMNLK